jgi:hypothetical protein
MRRHELEMKKLVRDLVVVAMLSIFSIAAFAQKQGQNQDRRPPKDKENVRVVDKRDNNRPPPQNNNQPKHNDKKGKP